MPHQRRKGLDPNGLRTYQAGTLSGCSLKVGSRTKPPSPKLPPLRPTKVPDTPGIVNKPISAIQVSTCPILTQSKSSVLQQKRTERQFKFHRTKLPISCSISPTSIPISSTNTPWYMRNSVLHHDLKTDKIEDYIQKMSRSFFNQIKCRSNPTISCQTFFALNVGLVG
ncbi:hypothetical protein AVEN_177797-1 [Araneus ventricosus]|uniref:Uncharacterized protein n=1 Tax=Araneus ventricosus TaxID=182803 RepID=A0A4Y2QPZ6_ARAVE|nr:hypothetical protein AVEN_167017-1 [Araneus ventricosus]GBN65383.1 hypothetical protein AVEN_177797-1 [Araneus ventricosus]